MREICRRHNAASRHNIYNDQIYKKLTSPAFIKDYISRLNSLLTLYYSIHEDPIINLIDWVNVKNQGEKAVIKY